MLAPPPSRLPPHGGGHGAPGIRAETSRATAAAERLVWDHVGCVPSPGPAGEEVLEVRRGWLRPLEARDESRGRAFPKARGLRCRQMKLQTSVPYLLCVSLYGLLCLGDERRTVA